MSNLIISIDFKMGNNDLQTLCIPAQIVLISYLQSFCLMFLMQLCYQYLPIINTRFLTLGNIQPKKDLRLYLFTYLHIPQGIGLTGP